MQARLRQDLPGHGREGARGHDPRRAHAPRCADARAGTETVCIVVQTDWDERVRGYANSWWEMATPMVSEMPAVNAAREEFDRNKGRQRYLMIPGAPFQQGGHGPVTRHGRAARSTGSRAGPGWRDPPDPAGRRRVALRVVRCAPPRRRWRGSRAPAMARRCSSSCSRARRRSASAASGWARSGRRATVFDEAARRRRPVRPGRGRRGCRRTGDVLLGIAAAPAGDVQPHRRRRAGDDPGRDARRGQLASGRSRTSCRPRRRRAG